VRVCAFAVECVSKHTISSNSMRSRDHSGLLSLRKHHRVTHIHTHQTHTHTHTRAQTHTHTRRDAHTHTHAHRHTHTHTHTHSQEESYTRACLPSESVRTLVHGQFVIVGSFVEKRAVGVAVNDLMLHHTQRSGRGGGGLLTLRLTRVEVLMKSQRSIETSE